VVGCRRRFFHIFPGKNSVSAKRESPSKRKGMRLLNAPTYVMVGDINVSLESDMTMEITSDMGCGFLLM
jgi:hypothetical protein